MAGTPQGNFTAYQQLKPTEPLKVGDLYSGLIDNMIKRNDAKTAAQLKALQEQKKTIGERFEKIKIDPFATTNNLTDAAQKAFKDTFDYYSSQRMLADRDPANAYQYLARAENAARDYLQTATTLGSPDFIKRANEKAEAVTSDEYYQNSDDIAQYKSLANGTFKVTRNPETGGMVYSLPGSPYAEDADPAVQMGSAEFLNKMTVLPEKNLLPTARKELTDVASKFAEEWKTNTDGNVTKTWQDFAGDRAKNYFNETYGEFNESYIPAELQQWSKDVLKKPIKSKEDFDAAIESKTEFVKSLVPVADSTDRRFTTAQLEAQNLNNKKTKVQIQKMQEKEQQLAVPTAETSIIRTYNPDGSYKGYFTGKTASVNLAGTTNFLSAHPVQGKDGKVTNRYYIGGFAKDGNIVYEPISNPLTAMTSAKIKDPVKVFAQLNQTAASLPVIKYGTRQTIVPKNNSKSKEYELTSVNIKAKAGEENNKQQFENNLYEGLLENQ